MGGATSKEDFQVSAVAPLPLKCPAGTYGATTGQSTSACSGQCSAGYYCAPGSTSPTQNQCPAGYYCTAGTGNPSSSNPPKICLAGTYSSPGAAVCSSCATTPAGRYCPIGSTNATGVLCPAGSYCPGGASPPVQCAGGTYSSAGATRCTSCSIGYYSAAAGSSCTPCTAPWGRYCPEGSTSANGSPCVPGSFCPGLSSAPIQCAPGEYSAANGQSCQACSAGSYSSAGASQCTPCAAGTYNPIKGASQCTQCAAGTYSGAFAFTCTQCAAGTYSAAGASQCTSCAAGTYSAAGASQCTSCGADAYSAPGASQCTACAAGTYYSATSASCIPCDSGARTASCLGVNYVVTDPPGSTTTLTGPSVVRAGNRITVFYRADIPVTTHTTSFGWGWSTYNVTVAMPQIGFAYRTPGGAVFMGDFTCDNYAHGFMGPNNLPRWELTLPGEHVLAELGTQMITIYNRATAQWGIQIPVAIIP